MDNLCYIEDVECVKLSLDIILFTIYFKKEKTQSFLQISIDICCAMMHVNGTLTGVTKDCYRQTFEN